MGRCALTTNTTNTDTNTTNTDTNTNTTMTTTDSTTIDRPAEPDAATRRALNRADQYGCAACAGQFEYGQPTALARVPGRVLSAYHINCVPAHGRITGLSALVTQDDPHTAVDRAWFASNPGRRAHMRPPADITELRLLAGRAALSVLRSGAPAETVDHVRQHIEQMIEAYQSDPLSVGMLVAQIEPGARTRYPVLLEPGTTVDQVSVEVIEQAGAALLGGHSLETLMEQYPIASHVEAQLLPTATLAAAANKRPTPLDIAQAEGQAIHAIKH